MAKIFCYVSNSQENMLMLKEDDLKKKCNQKQLKVKTMVVAPLRVPKLLYII